jgi:fructuronate reductase
LRALCLAAANDPAQGSDDGLADWIAAHCAFPNSMVDRIVPAASSVTGAEAAQALGVPDQAALRTEAFWEWVIERNFVDDTDAATLSAVGVQVVSLRRGSGRPSVSWNTSRTRPLQSSPLSGVLPP